MALKKVPRWRYFFLCLGGSFFSCRERWNSIWCYLKKSVVMVKILSFASGVGRGACNYLPWPGCLMANCSRMLHEYTNSAVIRAFVAYSWTVFLPKDHLNAPW